MLHPPMVAPWLDPTPIFEVFRGSYGTELLTAAVAHFRVFDLVKDEGRSPADLARALGLADRPATVLLTALRAMGLLSADARGRVVPTDLAREHLTTGAHFDVGGYIGLAANAPGVLGMVESLRSNRPIGADAPDDGAAFIYKEGIESAMEREATARSLTLALAGRARNVAPELAERYPLDGATLLLDVGGGTGITPSHGSSGIPTSGRSSGTGPKSSRWPPRWPSNTRSPTGSSYDRGTCSATPSPAAPTSSSSRTSCTTGTSPSAAT
jgi:hypothetical protein